MVPNGLAIRNGSLYVSDSALGAVWKAPLNGHSTPQTPWLEDDRLLPDHAIGANGIAFGPSGEMEPEPVIRKAIAHRRCLIPVDGFYEWQQHPGGKQPWHIGMIDDKTFALGGIWEYWAAEGHEPVLSCARVLSPKTCYGKMETSRVFVGG